MDVPADELTFSSKGTAIRADSLRALELLGKKFDLTNSEQLFLDLWLANFDDVKAKIGLLIDRYLETDPALVAELIRVSDRMDATLKGYLENDARLPFDRIADAAAEQDLRDVGPDSGDDGSSMDGGGAGAEATARQLLTWDDFEPFSCPICFDDVERAEDGFRSLPCGHKFCRACMSDNLSTQVGEARVLDIHCPGSQCEVLLSYPVIRALVDARTFARYEELTFLAALNTDPNVRWCPATGCHNAVVNDDPLNTKKIVCSRCSHAFCFDCNNDWHIGTCEDYERWRVENGQVDKEFAKWKKDNTKPCPNCKALIQKNSGCNHMTCATCHFQFCWLCLRKYTDSHFDPYNVLGCPGMQSGSTENFGAGKRMGIRILCGAGIAVGAPIALALAVPVAIIAGPIYGGYRLYKYRRNRRYY